MNGAREYDGAVGGRENSFGERRKANSTQHSTEIAHSNIAERGRQAGE